MRTWLPWLALAGCSSHGPTSSTDAPVMVSPFAVASARALSTQAIAITFTDPPAPGSAAVIANYTFQPTLALVGNSTLDGTTISLGTATQQATIYQLTISGVTRLADAAPLTTATTTFVGHKPFDVTSAVSGGMTSVVVTFDAAPDPVSATTLDNYSINDPNALVLSGTPQLAGNSVTLTTSAQAAVAYDCDVFGVTRASDGEPLYVNAGSFTGIDH